MTLKVIITNNIYCFLYDFRSGFFASIGVCTVVGTYQCCCNLFVKVAGMLICYIMSGGHHAYGENGLEITVSIQANWPKITHHQNKEIVCLVSDMLTMPPKDRPEFPAILK